MMAKLSAYSGLAASVLIDGVVGHHGLEDDHGHGHGILIYHHIDVLANLFANFLANLLVATIPSTTAAAAGTGRCLYLCLSRRC